MSLSNLDAAGNGGSCEDRKERKRRRDREEKLLDYRWCREHHICTACKKKDAYTIAGRTYCAECTEKRNARRRITESGQKKSRSDYDRARKERLASNGVCIQCGKRKTEDGKKICAFCGSIRNRKARQRRRDLNPDINWPRGDNGICYVCNRRPATNGMRTCTECREKMIANLNKSYRGAGPTAPRPSDHPFKKAERLRFAKYEKKTGDEGDGD